MPDDVQDVNTQDPTQTQEPEVENDTPEGIGETYASDGFFDFVNNVQRYSPLMTPQKLPNTTRAALSTGFNEQAIPGSAWLLGGVSQFVVDAIPFVETDGSEGTGAADTSWAQRLEATTRREVSPMLNRGAGIMDPSIRDVRLRLNIPQGGTADNDFFAIDDRDLDSATWTTRAMAQMGGMANGAGDLWDYAEIFDPSMEDNPDTVLDERWRPMRTDEKVAFGIGNLLGPENVIGLGVARYLAQAGKTGARLLDIMNTADNVSMAVMAVGGATAAIENPVRIRDYLEALNTPGAFDQDPMFFQDDRFYGVGRLQVETNLAMRDVINQEFDRVEGDVSQMRFRSMDITGEFSNNEDSKTNKLLCEAADTIGALVRVASGQELEATGSTYDGEVQRQVLAQWQQFDERFKNIAKGVFESDNPQQAMQDLSRTDLITLQMGLRIKLDGGIFIYGDSPEALAQTGEALNMYADYYQDAAFDSSYDSRFQLEMVISDNSSVPATLAQTYAANAAALQASGHIDAGDSISGVAPLHGGMDYSLLIGNRADTTGAMSGTDAAQAFRIFSDPYFLTGADGRTVSMQENIFELSHRTSGHPEYEVDPSALTGTYDRNTSADIAYVMGSAKSYITATVNSNDPEVIEARAAKAQFDKSALGTIRSIVGGTVSIDDLTPNQVTQVQLYLAINSGQVPSQFGPGNDMINERTMLGPRITRLLNAVGEDRGIEHLPNETPQAYFERVLNVMDQDANEALRLNGGERRAGLSGDFTGGADPRFAVDDATSPANRFGIGAGMSVDL